MSKCKLDQLNNINFLFMINFINKVLKLYNFHMNILKYHFYFLIYYL